MQVCAGPEAGVADIARVPVDLGGNQDHVAFEGTKWFFAILCRFGWGFIW